MRPRTEAETVRPRRLDGLLRITALTICGLILYAPLVIVALNLFAPAGN
jgi:hypothetical protein